MATGRLTKAGISYNVATRTGRITRAGISYSASVSIDVPDSTQLEPGIETTTTASISGGTVTTWTWTHNYSGNIDFSNVAGVLTWTPPATLNGIDIIWTATGTKSGQANVVATGTHSVLPWAGSWQYNSSNVLVPNFKR